MEVIPIRFFSDTANFRSAREGLTSHQYPRITTKVLLVLHTAFRDNAPLTRLTAPNTAAQSLSSAPAPLMAPGNTNELAMALVLGNGGRKMIGDLSGVTSTLAS